MILQIEQSMPKLEVSILYHTAMALAHQSWDLATKLESSKNRM
jgi:hypothetical protein